jgi:hypothetical protein
MTTKTKEGGMYKEKISQDVRNFISSFKTECQKKYQKDNPFIRCHFASYRIQDGKTTTRYNQPCYAVLHGILTVGIDYIYSIIDSQCPDEMDEEASLLYLDWLVNRSVFKDVFISRDAPTILKNGFLVRTDMSTRFTIQAMIAARYVWELPKMVKDWMEFSKHTDEMLALLLIHFFQIEGEQLRKRTGYKENPNHWFFNKDVRVARAMLKGEAEGAAKDTKINVNGHYSNMNMIWEATTWRHAFHDETGHGVKFPPPQTLIEKKGWRAIETALYYPLSSIKEFIQATIDLNDFSAVVR